MRMKINAYLIIGCIVFFETRASQHSNKVSGSTATHFPTKEKPLTTMANCSSLSYESIAHTGPARAGAAPTVNPTQTPVATAGFTPSNATHHSTGAQFHMPSFLGGMVLAFIITLAGCVGYRLVCSRQTVHYRVIEEHDAII